MKEEMPYGKKGIERLYLIIIFLFLYLPIAVLIVLSFNDSKSRVQWGGLHCAGTRRYLKAGPL